MARIIWERIGQLKYWQMKHIFGRSCIIRTQLGRLQTIVKLARKWKKKTYHQTCCHSSKDSLMNACRNTLWIKRWTLTGVNRAIFAATMGENIIKPVLQKSVCKFFTNPFFTNPFLTPSWIVMCNAESSVFYSCLFSRILHYLCLCLCLSVCCSSSYTHFVTSCSSLLCFALSGSGCATFTPNSNRDCKRAHSHDTSIEMICGGDKFGNPPCGCFGGTKYFYSRL